MTNQRLTQKLRRLLTLLTIGRRSNNLAAAIRKALELIGTWRVEVDVILAKIPVHQLFAGYGPKFIKLFNELIQTGDIALIRELQKDVDPFFCFLCEIPGIGEVMARRMYFDKSIRSMDDLRIAYSNNVLQRIPSFGDVRMRAIETTLWKSQNHAQGEDEAFEEDDLNALLVDMSQGAKVEMTPSKQFELFGGNAGSLMTPEEASAITTQIEVPPEVETGAQVSQVLPCGVEVPQVPREAPLFSQTLLEDLSISQKLDFGDAVSKKEELPHDSAYSEEFISSNSMLFRDASSAGQEAGTSSSDSHEAEEEASTPSRYACDRVQAQVIRVVTIEADILQVRQLRARKIQSLSGEVKSYSNAVIRREEIESESISANTVQADILDAESVSARIIIASLIHLVP